MKKPLLIFDYDGTIHETMALYQSAVSDTVSRLKELLEENPVSRSREQPEDTAASMEEERVQNQSISDHLRELSDEDRAVLLERFRMQPEEARLQKWIGMNPPDMWRDYAPELPEEIRNILIKQVGEKMDQKVKDASRWYPGTETILDVLREEGYPMLILSNCTETYAKTHWDHFRMQRWFLAFLASESYEHKPKEWIIEKLLSDSEAVVRESVCRNVGTTLRIRKAVVIGDRASDKRGAEENGLPFIGCLYGYGTKEELHGADAFITDPLQIPQCIKRISESSSDSLQI